MYLLLFVMWVIFNGQLTLEITLFGIVIAALMYWFICKFMDFDYDKDIYICKRVGKIIKYGFVLLVEIIKANAATIKMVMSRKHKPEPALVAFTVDLKTNTGRVMLANSITLTPGTITVALEGNRYTVHCLDKSFADGIDTSVFVKLISELEGDYPAYKEQQLLKRAQKKQQKEGNRE